MYFHEICFCAHLKGGGFLSILREALHLHRVRHHEEQLALGPVWDARLDLVFPNEIGSLLMPGNLTRRYFKKFPVRATFAFTICGIPRRCSGARRGAMSRW